MISNLFVEKKGNQVPFKQRVINWQFGARNSATTKGMEDLAEVVPEGLGLIPTLHPFHGLTFGKARTGPELCLHNGDTSAHSRGGPGHEVRNTAQCRPVWHLTTQQTFEFQFENSLHGARAILQCLAQDLLTSSGTVSSTKTGRRICGRQSRTLQRGTRADQV